MNRFRLTVRRQELARWWRRQGRCVPRFSSVDLLATLVLWIGATCGWEWYRACPGARLPFGLAVEESAGGLPAAGLPQPTPDLSQRAAAAGSAKRGAGDGPTVTAPTPDGDGFFGYQHDRFQLKSPVALRQLASSEAEPELTRARGRKEGLRFELDRVFDYRASDRDLSEVARGFAAGICQSAGAVVVETREQELQISGQRAVRTWVSMRQTASGRLITVEGLTIDEGLVAWSLWAGYDPKDAPAAERVNRCFASATLRPLSAQSAALARRQAADGLVLPVSAAAMVEPR